MVSKIESTGLTFAKIWVEVLTIQHEAFPDSI